MVYQASFEIRSAELTSKPSTYHQFEVVRLWEIPTEQLLSYPGLMPLAVLGKTNNMEDTLREVAQQIDRVDDARLRSNLVSSSAILSALKLDKDVIKQILRRDIMRESPMYQEILEEGKQEGKLEGRLEGKLEEREHIAQRLLSLGMTIEQVALATELSIEQIKSLTQK